jgi:hypothetical protein
VLVERLHVEALGEQIGGVLLGLLRVAFSSPSD